jgi:hypothetical protein
VLQPGLTAHASADSLVQKNCILLARFRAVRVTEISLKPTAKSKSRLTTPRRLSVFTSNIRLLASSHLEQGCRLADVG